MKKFVEPEAPNLVGKNKFANLEDEAGSASDPEA